MKTAKKRLLGTKKIRQIKKKDYMTDFAKKLQKNGFIINNNDVEEDMYSFKPFDNFESFLNKNRNIHISIASHT
ncbi:MAG: hypothetical protein LBH45_07270 [Campylobacteraceae bacterium]|jgi:hypothetical protein|nr:hypothetical protein [Campylobacteraceae bacterium]